MSLQMTWLPSFISMICPNAVADIEDFSIA